MKPLIIAVLSMTVAFISHAQNNEYQKGSIDNNSTQGVESKASSDASNVAFLEKEKQVFDQRSNIINPNEDTIKRRRQYTSQDSLRLNQFRRISPPSQVNRPVEIKAEETEVPSTPKKVKNVSVNNESEEADYVNMPELDLIISQYSENQREIKSAKSLNDLEKLDELEQKSTSIKTNFVSVYKSTDPKNLNPEYRRFYVDFEKDVLTK